MRRILAIDLGTQFGWAMSPDGMTIESGTERLEQKRGDSHGIRFLRFRTKLCELIRPTNIQGYSLIDVIAFEKPHARGGAATEILHGMRGVLLEVATSHDLGTMEIRAATAKKTATGRGNATKQLMLAAAYRRWPEQFWPRPEPGDTSVGFKMPGDSDGHYDQADALWLLETAREEIG